MKKLVVVLSFLLVSQFVLGGIEFIGVDGVATTYDAGTGILSMNGDPLVIIVYCRRYVKSWKMRGLSYMASSNLPMIYS